MSKMDEKKTGSGFLLASSADILSGSVTDVYFRRTLQILKARGVNPRVRAEFIAKGFPNDWPWAVFAGLNEALSVLERLPVKVRAIKEGSLFYPWEPVLELEGRYRDFCVFETALLGLLCQASGVATQAARFRQLVGKRMLMSFGARRMHPAIAPMIERNAFLGGCDGVSVVKSAEAIGEHPMGTMPHALILCMGSTLEAMRAYDEVLPPDVKRVVLIDTFEDEKFESIKIAEALGDRLYGIRFDTPSSRRGDFAAILKECRWELDTRGHGHVKFFVSGGIKEADVPVLNPLVDGYGIGTTISNAPVVDFSMDIVEIDGEPRAKRGKRSGGKRLLQCPKCREHHVIPIEKGRSALKCECGGRMKDLLLPVMDNGRSARKPETVSKIRSRVIASLRKKVPSVA